jgi:lambda repressor-like predicted transcriptional regulator
LRTGGSTPTVKALKKGFCKVGGGGALVLWHRQRTIAALKAAGHSTAHENHAKLALTTMIATARSVMEWGEIQEALIAAKAKEHGVEARII